MSGHSQDPTGRRQRRRQERVKQEASRLLDQLVTKYVIEMGKHSDDLEGEEMADVYERLNNRWIAYSKIKLVNGNGLFAAEVKAIMAKMEKFVEQEKQKNNVPEEAEGVADQGGVQQD